MNGNELAKPVNDGALDVVQVKGQIQLVQDVMRGVMQKGVHYGQVPGCGPTPTLLKAGAEKLCLTFRLAPDFGFGVENHPKRHGADREQCRAE